MLQTMLQTAASVNECKLHRSAWLEVTADVLSTPAPDTTLPMSGGLPVESEHTGTMDDWLWFTS